jgi:two-component system, sensor histidine kinase and response regulator
LFKVITTLKSADYFDLKSLEAAAQHPWLCPQNTGFHVLFFKTTGKIPRLKPKTLHRTWPIATFEAVYQLLQQMAELPGAIWLASESIAFVENMGESPSERFAVVVSEQLSALVRGKQDELGTNQHQESEKNHNFQLNVELTFEPGAIANFLSPLADKLSKITPASSLPIDMIALKQGMKNIQPNSPEVQSEFTLILLEIIGFQGANSRNPLATNQEKSGKNSRNNSWLPQR